MKETAHIRPVIKQIKPEVGCFSYFAWTHTIIAPSQWQVLYFNEKSFFFLFYLPVTATGFTLSKIFSLSIHGIASGCCMQFWASSCKIDVDSLGNIQQKRVLMVDTCSRRGGWRDRAVQHGEGAVSGSPNSSPCQCPQGGFKETELAGEQAEVINWMKTGSDLTKGKRFPCKCS